MKKVFFMMLCAALLMGISPGMASAQDFGYIPNSGEASVSKVNLTTGTAVARYYTAPRLGQLVDNLGEPSDTPFLINPYAWRAGRIGIDPYGNAWSINTGVDGQVYGITFRSLQGTIARIQGDTSALGDTDGDGTIQTNSNHAAPLPFGDDDAVQVFEVGSPGDIPRTVNFDAAGNLWIGFHMAFKKWGYFQKYTYDPAAKTLIPAGAPVTTTLYDIAPYNADIDKEGVLWFVSYGTSALQRSTGTYAANNGVYSFDTDDETPVITKYTGVTSGYGIKVDDSTYPDITVYVTILENSTTMYKSVNYGYFATVTVTGANGMRGMEFDDYGTLWIASSANNKVCWYNPDLEPSSGCTGFAVCTETVGMGKDADGDMWVVCRNNAQYPATPNTGTIRKFTPPEFPNTTPLTSGMFTPVTVGYRPYAYANFTTQSVNFYDICGYKYLAGTATGLEGWEINLYLYDPVSDQWSADPIRTATTDETGLYCFSGLPWGDYRVTETLQLYWGQVSPTNNQYDVTIPADATAPIEKSPLYNFENRECAFDMTAWSAGTRYVPRGNWATYTAYNDEAQTVTLYAGQTYPAGTVAFSAPDSGNVTITISLNTDWRFDDVAENVMIQGYNAAPSGNPSPGLFTTFKGKATESSIEITVPRFLYYGIHVNVEQLTETCTF